MSSTCMLLLFFFFFGITTCMLLENEKGEKKLICFYVFEIRREKLKAFHSQYLDD